MGALSILIWLMALSTCIYDYDSGDEMSIVWNRNGCPDMSGFVELSYYIFTLIVFEFYKL